MFGQFGWQELLIILVLVILIFGVGRISKISGELGSSLRNFRKGLQGDDDKKEEPGEDKNPPAKP